MRTSTDRRRGYASGDARRERILHIATQEFAEHGYRGTSLARVAERAGLSQPGLLHHFRTKEQLLVAVLELRDQRDMERFFADEAAGGLDLLTALVRVVEHNSRTPELVRLFVVLTSEAVTADHPAQDWARARYERLRAWVADALRRAAGAGEVRPGLDADATAARIIALMDGLQTQWLLDPDAIDMPALFRAHIDELLATLRPRA
ncbi:TetR/AcrR family transcriptional regulator [Actinomadura montaniterrae]|uniref:TetR/AcrR family transcriptional regulator n=1 Tax=Actinomadura montaniterrae TaxID=1803903 RepID=A0A6L3VUA7_9ACTN|nr:TetR/AcrR family transcriptional regulator [Actinomadura montaniterrae]KAB2376890.1 TetR/AcrR family transcriptional regulator [Actinomadura montaniterrae]